MVIETVSGTQFSWKPSPGWSSTNRLHPLYAIMVASDGTASRRLRICCTPVASFLRPALIFPLFLFVTKEYAPLCVCNPGRLVRSKPGRKKNNSPDIPRPQHHQVICADCRASTTVPFLPVKGRPVYCSDCLYLRRTSVDALIKSPRSNLHPEWETHIAERVRQWRPGQRQRRVSFR